MLHPLFFRCFCFFAALGTAACMDPPRVALLRIDGIDTTASEETGAVRVLASGIPAGRDTTVRFEGTQRRAGARDRAVVFETSGRSGAGVVEIDGEALAAEIGAGTFIGAIEVAISGAQGQEVMGRRDHVTVQIPETAADRPARAEREEEAAQFSSEVGIRFDEENPAAGLEVEEIARGSKAGAAGLRAGDVLLALDGLALHAMDDFLPPVDQDSAALRVVGPDRRGPATVRLDLSEGRADVGKLAAIWIGIVACLAFLGGIAPTARIAVRVERRCAEWIAALSGGAWVRWAASPSSTPRDRIRTAAALGIGLSTASVLALAPIDLGVLALGTSAAGAALYAIDPLRRGTALRGFALGRAAALVALIPVFLHQGALDAATSMRDQGPAPWQWAISESPAHLLAFAAWMEGGVIGDRRATDPASVLFRTLFAAIAAILFLGGGAGGGWAGPLLVVLKTSALLAIGMGVAPLGNRGFAPLAAVLSAVLAVVIPAGGVYAAWLSPIALTVLAALLLASLARTIRAESPPSAYATHPLV